MPQQPPKFGKFPSYSDKISYVTPLPDAQDGLTFNERRLDSARTTTHVVDAMSDMNTVAGQGLSRHPLNRSDMGTTSMPQNRPQTDGTTYPNNTNITARDTKIKMDCSTYKGGY